MVVGSDVQVFHLIGRYALLEAGYNRVVDADLKSGERAGILGENSARVAEEGFPALSL